MRMEKGIKATQNAQERLVYKGTFPRGFTKLERASGVIAQKDEYKSVGLGPKRLLPRYISKEKKKIRP